MRGARRRCGQECWFVCYCSFILLLLLINTQYARSYIRHILRHLSAYTVDWYSC